MNTMKGTPMAKMSKPRAQSPVSINAKYASSPSNLGPGGRNAPSPKVKDCGSSKSVKAKPQGQVYPGKS